MSRLAWLGLAVLIGVPALAQHRFVFREGTRIGGREFGHGFGSVVFPGGIPPRPGAIADPGFAHRLGGIVGGFRPYTGAPLGARRYGRTIPVAVPFPVFVGGYPYYPEYPPPQQPAVVVVPQSPAPPPQIVINQYFPAKPEESRAEIVDSSVQVYQAPAPSQAPPSSQDPTIYLIAFQDGSVRTAVAYWVEDDTLHYVTPNGRPNKASLELVDVAYSRRLNRERNVPFEWPHK